MNIAFEFTCIGLTDRLIIAVVPLLAIVAVRGVMATIHRAKVIDDGYERVARSRRNLRPSREVNIGYGISNESLIFYVMRLLKTKTEVKSVEC